MAHFVIAFEYPKLGRDGKKIVRFVLPWKQTCCHSNQKYVSNSLIIAYFGSRFGLGRFEKMQGGC